MRFFLVDGSIPAFEPERGRMMLLLNDGQWASIAASEVLADERSPEIDEASFHDLIKHEGASLPEGLTPPPPA
jgi:hypothetical protein